MLLRERLVIHDPQMPVPGVFEPQRTAKHLMNRIRRRSLSRSKHRVESRVLCREVVRVCREKLLQLVVNWRQFNLAIGIITLR